MVRFHYRSHAVKPRQYRAFANHCFGSTLRSISNTFTSHILCLSYAYRVITRILFTHCDSQYLTLEVGMEWPLHTSRACALRHALHGGIVYEYESIRLSCTLMTLYSCSWIFFYCLFILCVFRCTSDVVICIRVFTAHVLCVSGAKSAARRVRVNKSGICEVCFKAIVVSTLIDFLCTMKAWQYSNS